MPITLPTLHILGFAQTLRGGGVERAQLRLARDWLAAGHRVTLVIGDPHGPLADELPAGVETIITGSSSFVRLLLAVPGQVRAARPDIVFCPGNHYSSIAAWTRIRLGRACPPIVAKVSNRLDRPDHTGGSARRYRFWLRLHPHFVDHFVAMTPAMAAETIAMLRLPTARVSVIPNPPARPIPGAPMPHLPAGRFLLGVGRLAPQKRWDRLIAALPRIADRDISLLLLGEGKERVRLEQQVAALGLAHRILLPGHVVDPSSAIARASVVALVSDYEGVPGVLREALALATPVVTTDSSVATREIVTDPSLGSVVASGDEDALVAALDHWLVPGRARPAAVPQPGEDSAACYLDLFGRLLRHDR